MNLTRNSSKFVESGFICIKGAVVEGLVQLCVKDSRPGIPPDKRASVFAKFQTSLEQLSQGTGVGLCLSKQLMTTMGGDLWLDDTYRSGITNQPSAQFVVQLNVPPSQFHPIDSNVEMPLDESTMRTTMQNSASTSVHDFGSKSNHSQDGVASDQNAVTLSSSDTTMPVAAVNGKRQP